MKTRKEGTEPLQMSHVREMVERVRAHISRPEVAGFTIGYSSGPPKKRVRGSDHRDHARTEEPITLGEGLTRQQALDLEAQLTAHFKHDPKYDKRGIRYTRSAGGGPRVPPDSPVHVVYLAWASVSGRTRHDEKNRVLLDEISRRGDPKARVNPWIDDDHSYLIALSAPGHFVVAIGKQNVHFHSAQCRFARLARPSDNPHPLTGKGQKNIPAKAWRLYIARRSKIARESSLIKRIAGRSVIASLRD